MPIGAEQTSGFFSASCLPRLRGSFLNDDRITNLASLAASAEP